MHFKDKKLCSFLLFVNLVRRKQVENFPHFFFFLTRSQTLDLIKINLHVGVSEMFHDNHIPHIKRKAVFVKDMKFELWQL